LLGCGKSPHTSSCKVGFIGDATQMPEVQMLVTDGKSGMLQAVADGDSIPMEPPPQGGFVSYIGAAARNLDGCNVNLAGTLRDPATGDELGFDARDTNLVVGADGWGRNDASDNSNESNVNVCPDYTPVDRVNGTFNLEMKVTDRAGRTASVTHPVKLVCDPSLSPMESALCVCTCSANYVLGRCNHLDGGVSD
jgi:hypothetical protein